MCSISSAGALISGGASRHLLGGTNSEQLGKVAAAIPSVMDDALGPVWLWDDQPTLKHNAKETSVHPMILLQGSAVGVEKHELME